MSDAQRLDRWLWFARFFKSRSLAGKLCAAQKVRVNRRVVAKASTSIRLGDVLTFPQGNRIRVVKIVALGARRGPAAEAQLLYEDLTPVSKPAPASTPAAPTRPQGSGRPTKRDRRAIDRLQDDTAPAKTRLTPHR